MNRNVCKAILKDGSPCMRLVDDGQKFCPYHLSTQANKFKTALNWAGKGAALLVAIVAVVNSQMKKRS